MALVAYMYRPGGALGVPLRHGAAVVFNFARVLFVGANYFLGPHRALSAKKERPHLLFFPIPRGVRQASITHASFM
jgi:hypothetical protein